MVIASMKLNLENSKKEEFYKITKILIGKTKLLDSPITYNCNEDIDGNGDFIWNELWLSKLDLDKHLASDHVQDWWMWVEPRLRERLNVMYVEMANIKNI